MINPQVRRPKRHFPAPTGPNISSSGSVQGRLKISYLVFDRTARKDLDFRKSQIVLLYLWQRKLHELEAEREREMSNSVAVTFPWATKLSRSHGLALSESTVLSATHPCTGFQHTKLTDTQSSFCGSDWQNSPWLSELSCGYGPFVNVLVIQTLNPESKESVGFRHFIWISFFPSSQHSCWDVKPSVLIDTVCLTRSFRTANIHFTR